MTKKFAKKLGRIFSVFKPKGEPTNDVPVCRKMVIVGDGECGKTCLVTRMCTGGFIDVGYLPTVFDAELVTVNIGKGDVNLTICDTAGQEDYDRLRPFSYIDVNVAIICFDLADTDTLTNAMERWAPEIRKVCGGIPLILVGNKKDLRDSPIPHGSETSSSVKSDSSDISIQNPIDSFQYDSSDVDKESCSSGTPQEDDFRHSRLVTRSSVSSARMPFHVQAPVKYSEGARVAKNIGAIAYVETSALSGDNVEELLLATAKASVLGSNKSKTFRPFLGTLKSWKSVKGLEHLSRRVV